MFNLGPWELAFLFLIVLLIFGPKSLPRVGQALGRGIKEFKDAAKGLTADLAEDDDRDKRRAELAHKPNEVVPDSVVPPAVVESQVHKS